MSKDSGLGGSGSAPWFKQLHWQIAMGIVFALIYGIAIRTIWPLAGAADPDAILAIWNNAAAPFAFLGDLFIRALKLIIIPLVVLSVVTGIRNIGDASSLGKMGLRTVGYYLLTTFLAVLTGLVVVNLIDPGVGLDLGFEAGERIAPKPLSEVFANMIPKSALAAFAANDMLPSIFVAILMGVGLLSIGKDGEPLAKLFDSGNALVLKITSWIMATAPVGVAALFIKTLLDPKLADLASFFTDLGAYMLAVVMGLGVHAFILLPLLYKMFVRKSPLAFLHAMAPSLLTAFSTASSSATYPVTLDCVTERAGVSRKSASFVLPLGATINMDGTALYEAVAAIFIANALGVDLSLTQQAIVALTATLAAIGAAGVPSAGLVTMIIVLESVGLPAGAYGLVVAVDRVLDMCRTTVNVWGDAVGAAVVDATLPEPSVVNKSQDT